jgi:hypothetical protein
MNSKIKDALAIVAVFLSQLPLLLCLLLHHHRLRNRWPG